MLRGRVKSFYNCYHLPSIMMASLCSKSSKSIIKYLPMSTIMQLKGISTSQGSAAKKHIRFSDFDAIGFDCDHTLAQYHLHFLFSDTYASLADFLSNEKGYRREIFKFKPGFCSKGLILDLEKGNFMKLGHDGRILRASHGSRMIQRADFSTHFPSPTWPHHCTLSQTMTNIGDRFRIFENFFDMASSLICAQIIDHLDEKHNNQPPSYNIWSDVEEAINHVYIPDPFKAINGMFFARWLKETDRYVEQWSVAKREWLVRLKRSGDGREKPLFLLSSAYEDFAGATMAFVFGDDWERYFDFSIFLAHKPGFFTSDKPFFHLVHNEDGSVETRSVADLSEDSRFHGGNLLLLQTHLSNITNKQQPKVLFFGDSLRSDIIPSKVHADWHTVTVLEEMASEQCFHHHRPDNLEIQECDVDDESVMPWGSVLVERGGQKVGGGSMTMVHHVIQKYSDIAVPNLEFLLDYPPDHKFETFNSSQNPTLSGFHPFIPHTLK